MEVPGKNQQVSAKAGKVHHLIPIADPAASADSNPLQLIFQCMVPRKSSLAIQTQVGKFADSAVGMEVPGKNQQVSAKAGKVHHRGTTCPSGRLSRLIPIADPAASADSNPLQLIFQCMVSQNLSNYLWRVTLVHSTSFPCIVRSGTSPECAMFGHTTS
jgi:hypothetical protein